VKTVVIVADGIIPESHDKTLVGHRDCPFLLEMVLLDD
jgi:hypothetical protein